MFVEHYSGNNGATELLPSAAHRSPPAQEPKLPPRWLWSPDDLIRLGSGTPSLWWDLAGDTVPVSLCPVCGRVWRDGDHVTCRHHSPHSLTRPVAATVDRWYLAATIWPLLHRNHLPPLASHSSHTTFGYWDLIFRVWSSQQPSPPRCHSQRVTVRLYEIWDIIWRYNVLILDKYLFSGGTRHQPQPSRQINLTCHECSATILSTVFIHVKYLDISMVLINGPVMDSTCSTNTKYQMLKQTPNIKC